MTSHEFRCHIHLPHPTYKISRWKLVNVAKQSKFCGIFLISFQMRLKCINFNFYDLKKAEKYTKWRGDFLLYTGSQYW